MGKRKLINQIKKFVEGFEDGCVTMADLEADSSPVVNSSGKNTFQLIERLYNEKVETVIYVHDREESSEFINYGDLSEDNLNEIVELINTYKETNDIGLELNDEEN